MLGKPDSNFLNLTPGEEAYYIYNQKIRISSADDLTGLVRYAGINPPFHGHIVIIENVNTIEDWVSATNAGYTHTDGTKAEIEDYIYRFYPLRLAREEGIRIIRD
jgi:hypothetical protein